MLASRQCLHVAQRRVIAPLCARLLTIVSDSPLDRKVKQNWEVLSEITMNADPYKVNLAELKISRADNPPCHSLDKVDNITFVMLGTITVGRLQLQKTSSDINVPISTISQQRPNNQHSNRIENTDDSMSTLTLPSHIVISESGGLTLRLYIVEDDNDSFLAADKEKTITGRILATMAVSREVMLEHSPVYDAFFKRWAKPDQGTVDFKVDKERALVCIEVVLRALHKTLLDASYAIDIEAIWEVIEWCNNRQIDTEKLEDWFSTWWEKRDKKKLKIDEMRMLLTPAYTFDHVHAFAFLTRYLAYNMADHITEYNPSGYWSIHLNNNAIGSINGARGSLRSKMLRELFDPVSAFLVMNCDCKEKSLFAYNKGLSKTGIWPLHEHYKKSVQEVLTSPGFLKFDCKIPDNACMTCRSKLSVNAIEKIRCELIGNFNGLCLDCMNLTKSGDVDYDYWEHDFEREWDLGCRISHSQPTWYFSFMGRKEDMKNHKIVKKVRRL